MKACAASVTSSKSPDLWQTVAKCSELLQAVRPGRRHPGQDMGARAWEGDRRYLWALGAFLLSDSKVGFKHFSTTSKLVNKNAFFARPV